VAIKKSDFSKKSDFFLNGVVCKFPLSCTRHTTRLPQHHCWLVVKMKGQPDRTLEALSSGERQIVTILAHLALGEHRSRAGVFIVDEQELSLHLKWQEIFI
jgi:ABC-type hemin transport system ATPase subunit